MEKQRKSQSLTKYITFKFLCEIRFCLSRLDVVQLTRTTTGGGGSVGGDGSLVLLLPSQTPGGQIKQTAFIGQTQFSAQTPRPPADRL